MARSTTGGGIEATTLIFPKDKTLTDLAKLKRSTKQRTQSISGEYGNAVGQAVEKDHLDRKALAIALKLDGMDDDDLHVTLMHVIHYCKALGVLKRGMAQEEMFSPDETGPDAVGGKKPRKAKKSEPKSSGGRAPRGANVISMGDAARQVAEAAGADK